MVPQEDEENQWSGQQEQQADDGEYGDLYAIPTQHSEPVKRGVKDEEEEGDADQQAGFL